MLYLLLQDDWEIYTSGSGDPEKLMFEPAKRILDICDTYGARYTFFADIGLQINMLSSNSNYWKKRARKWELILKDAIKRGHDVQLHFHPQWIDAKLLDGCWQLNLNNFHTAHIPEETLNSWLSKGIKYMEGLFTPINKNYQVVAYRAGETLCQPSNTIYNVLKRNKIICDSSVINGRFKKYSAGGFVDYLNTVSPTEPWEVDPNDFSKEKNGSGIWELPIYTNISSVPNKFFLLLKAFKPLYYYNIRKKLKDKAKQHKIEKQSIKDFKPKVIGSPLKNYFWGDFGYMHYKHLSGIVKEVNKRRPEGINKYIILLSHSKTFIDYKNFELFLKKQAQSYDVSFSTTREFVLNRFGKTQE